MILGFAFRSPDIVRHTIDRTKFAAFVIPRFSESGVHVNAYENAMTQPVGNRKRVILFSDCKSFTSVSRSGKFQSTKHIYVVFDSASVLASKSCVEIVDINSQANVPVWQYQRTLPSTLAKTFQSATEGISDEDLECMNAVVENPEARIKSDVPKREEVTVTTITLSTAVKSISERKVFQQDRNVGRLIVCMYIAGMFHNKSDVKYKTRNLKYIGLNNVGSYKKESVPSAVENMKKYAKSKYGIKLGSKTVDSICDLVKHNGYSVSMLGMLLVSKGVNVDKACADTGADHAFLQMWKREFDTIRNNPSVSGAFQNAGIAFPLMILKHKIIKEAEADRELKRKYNLKKRIVIRAGKYTEETLLRECGLLKPGENFTAIMSGKINHTFSTNVAKFKTKKSLKPFYMVEKGKKCFVMFRSIRLKVMGA